MTTAVNHAEKLRDLAERVQAAREAAATLRASVAAAREQFNTQNAPLLEAAIKAQTEQADLETQLREAAEAAYGETGDKRPGPGVSIRLITRPSYEPADALAWAKEHDLFLAPDAKTFEAFARKSPAAVPFVLQVTMAQATIASDLRKVLACPICGGPLQADGRCSDCSQQDDDLPF